MGTRCLPYDHVELRAAYAGFDVDWYKEHDGAPVQWTSDVGQDIWDYYRYAPVGQAIGRFGRFDTEPTVVAVDSYCIPDCFDVIDATDRIVKLSELEKKAVKLLASNEMSAQEMKERTKHSYNGFRKALIRLIEKEIVDYANSPGLQQQFQLQKTAVNDRYYLLDIADVHFDAPMSLLQARFGRTDHQFAAEEKIFVGRTITEYVDPPPEEA